MTAEGRGSGAGSQAGAAGCWHAGTVSGLAGLPAGAAGRTGFTEGDRRAAGLPAGCPGGLA